MIRRKQTWSSSISQDHPSASCLTHWTQLENIFHPCNPSSCSKTSQGFWTGEGWQQSSWGYQAPQLIAHRLYKTKRKNENQNPKAPNKQISHSIMLKTQDLKLHDQQDRLRNWTKGNKVHSYRVRPGESQKVFQKWNTRIVNFLRLLAKCIS